MAKLALFALTFTAILAFSAASSYRTTIVTETHGLDNGFWPYGTDGLQKNNVKSVNDLRIPIGEGLDNKNHVKSTNDLPFPIGEGLDNKNHVKYSTNDLRIPYGEGLDNRNHARSTNDLRIPIGEGLDNGPVPYWPEGLDNGIYPREDGLGNKNNVKYIINSGLVKRQHLRS